MGCGSPVSGRGGRHLCRAEDDLYDKPNCSPEPSPVGGRTPFAEKISQDLKGWSGQDEHDHLCRRDLAPTSLTVEPILWEERCIFPLKSVRREISPKEASFLGGGTGEAPHASEHQRCSSSCGEDDARTHQQPCPLSARVRQFYLYRFGSGARVNRSCRLPFVVG